MSFFAYMLRCADDSLYVGHTDDLDRRVSQHATGEFQGWTADRRPVELAWSEAFPTREEALAMEAKLKGWSRAKKLALIRGDWSEISRLASRKRKLSSNNVSPSFETPAVQAPQDER